VASVSSSHLILFIASLIVAASVAGTFTQGVQRLSSAVGERSIDVSGDIRTDVSIISDPGSGAIANGDEITVLIKNTGSRSLEAESNRIEVLVDGKYQTDVSVSVVDGPTWETGNVAEVTVTVSSLSSGDHRVKVIVNGDDEVLRFRTES